MVEICKSYLAAPVKCISGVTGSDLRRRIEVVMKNGIAQRLAVGKRILIVTFGTVAVCGPIAIGFLNVQQNSAQFLSAGLSTATLVRGETSALPHIQQTGTAVGNEQVQTALVTGRPSVFQASSAPQGPQDIKAEQGNEKSECEQPGDQALILQRAKDLGFGGYGDTYVRTAMERWRQQLDLPTMEALEQDLVSRGLNPDEVKEKMRVMVLTSRVQNDFQSQVQYPTYKDIRRYYDEHAQDFNRPAGVHVREITILTGNREPEQIERQRKKAEAALKAVKGGADFAAVAARFSESLTAQVSGGDMGFSVKGKFGELEEVIDKLEQGEVSDIIQVEGAFMIIKVEYVHLGGVLPFELVQQEIIKAILSRQSNKPDWCEYLAKLRPNGRR
jgi:hypothetical protein